MFIKLSIKSKRKKSLFFFLYVLNKFDQNEKLKIVPREKFKKYFTVLKSPHVNKTAQEQFEFNLFSIKITTNKFQISKLLIILKKIVNNFCYDIYIKIEFLINVKEQKVNLLTYHLKYKNFSGECSMSGVQKNLLNLNFFGKFLFNKLSK